MQATVKKIFGTAWLLFKVGFLIYFTIEMARTSSSLVQFFACMFVFAFVVLCLSPFTKYIDAEFKE